MSSSAAETVSVRLDEGLFENCMSPEAVLLTWAAADGAWIERGERLAEVLVEDMRHEITAPISGRLLDPAPLSAVLEPGDAICRLDPSTRA
jgi:predicted deacylase